MIQKLGKIQDQFEETSAFLSRYSNKWYFFQIHFQPQQKIIPISPSKLFISYHKILEILKLVSKQIKKNCKPQSKRCLSYDPMLIIVRRGRKLESNPERVFMQQWNRNNKFDNLIAVNLSRGTKTHKNFPLQLNRFASLEKAIKRRCNWSRKRWHQLGCSPWRMNQNCTRTNRIESKFVVELLLKQHSTATNYFPISQFNFMKFSLRNRFLEETEV